MTLNESGKNGGGERSRMSSGLMQFVIALVVVGYLAAVLSGAIQKDNKIDTATLGLIGLAVIVIGVMRRPDILEGIKHLEFAGLKVDIEEKLQRQDSQLNAMLYLVAPLLLPSNERQHLLNLADQKTDHYNANDGLFSDLRRLRSMKLTRMRSDQNGAPRNISSLSGKKDFDLAKYVQLTELGKNWVTKIREIEESESAKETKADASAA